jgi:hypothetical protein
MLSVREAEGRDLSHITPMYIDQQKMENDISNNSQYIFDDKSSVGGSKQAHRFGNENDLVMVSERGELEDALDKAGRISVRQLRIIDKHEDNLSAWQR